MERAEQERQWTALMERSLQGDAHAYQELLARYVEAFEQYDMEALTALIHEDATQSMPPFDLWLTGRADIFTWWYGPGIGCSGSRVVPAPAAPVSDIRVRKSA